MYSRAARRWGHWVEAQTLGRFGPYKFVKGLTGAIGGEAGDAGFRPALLTLPNGTKAFVLIIEEHGDEAATVFLPSAPTPTVGTVQIAERKQLQALNLRGREVMQMLSQWGFGARGLLEKARTTSALHSDGTPPRP